MSLKTADGLEEYRRDIVDRLLRLRRENASCWRVMGIEVNERPRADALAGGNIVQWLEPPLQGTVRT